MVSMSSFPNRILSDSASILAVSAELSVIFSVIPVLDK
jgi:hypothetical protein